MAPSHAEDGGDSDEGDTPAKAQHRGAGHEAEVASFSHQDDAASRAPEPADHRRDSEPEAAMPTHAAEPNPYKEQPAVGDESTLPLPPAADHGPETPQGQAVAGRTPASSASKGLSLIMDYGDSDSDSELSRAPTPPGPASEVGDRPVDGGPEAVDIGAMEANGVEAQGAVVVKAEVPIGADDVGGMGGPRQQEASARQGLNDGDAMSGPESGPELIDGDGVGDGAARQSVGAGPACSANPLEAGGAVNGADVAPVQSGSESVPGPAATLPRTRYINGGIVVFVDVSGHPYRPLGNTQCR
jgi:hypothetical protein